MGSQLPHRTLGKLRPGDSKPFSPPGLSPSVGKIKMNEGIPNVLPAHSSPGGQGTAVFGVRPRRCLWEVSLEAMEERSVQKDPPKCECEGQGEPLRCWKRLVDSQGTGTCTSGSS